RFAELPAHLEEASLEPRLGLERIEDAHRLLDGLETVQLAGRPRSAARHERRVGAEVVERAARSGRAEEARPAGAREERRVRAAAHQGPVDEDLLHHGRVRMDRAEGAVQIAAPPRLTRGSGLSYSARAFLHRRERST